MILEGLKKNGLEVKINDSKENIRNFLKKNLQQFSCGIIKNNENQVEYVFYRRYGDKIHWEKWNVLNPLF